MKQKLSWLVIGMGAIAVASIVNSLEWGPSPQQAMAQVDNPTDKVEPDPPFGTGAPTPGNPNPPEIPYRGRRGAAGLPGGATPKRYRESTRRIARPVTENGQTRLVYEEEKVMVPDTNAGKKQELNAAVRTAIVNYQTAEDAKSRTEIEAQLTQSLSELFDLQQTEREEQLKPMEERVKKLRDTLNKRAALRDDLIQLRLKVLLQDAEGLGWGTDDEFLPRTMSGPGLAPTYEPADAPAYGSPDDGYRTTPIPDSKSRPAKKPQPRDVEPLNEKPASVPSP